MFNQTFDASTALSSIFLWVLFGHLSKLLNCDLQRIMVSHPFVVHLIGIATFFFLFTILDPSNKNHISIVWFKTIFVYTIFIIMTKSKWYFIAPILGLLLIDQTLKKHVAIQTERGDDTDKLQKIQKDISNILVIIILSLIFIGAAHYMYLQRIEYKNDFSMTKFLFGVTTCKTKTPTYKTQLS